MFFTDYKLVDLLIELGLQSDLILLNPIQHRIVVIFSLDLLTGDCQHEKGIVGGISLHVLAKRSCRPVGLLKLIFAL